MRGRKMEISDCWIDSVGGRVRVLDVSPEDSFKNTNTETVLLACGWSESIESVRATAYELAKIGYRSLSVDYAELDDLKDVQRIGGIFPRSESIKSLALLKILETKKIKDVIGVGHSEGAISIIGAAHLSPEVFKKIILITPAGLIEGESFLGLAYRFLANLILDTLRSPIRATYYSRIICYFAKNPIQTVREAVWIARIDLSQIIFDMQNGGFPRPILIVYGKKDKLFSSKLVEEVIRKKGLKNFFLFDGEHNDIHTRADFFVPFLDTIIRK